MESRARYGMLALLCAADLLVMLDGMIVTVALSAIERDLGTPRADLQWVVTAAAIPATRQRNGDHGVAVASNPRRRGAVRRSPRRLASANSA
jgi:NaMN:DMB phosphoribosyltransferase